MSETTPNITINPASEKLKAMMPATKEGAVATANIPKEEFVAEVKVENVPAAEVKKEDVQTGAAESDLTKYLKEHNISSIDELNDRLTPKRVKTADEEEAEFIDYGVKNGNLKVDDFLSAKEIQNKKDADVTFDAFAAKLQSKNKSITQEEIQAKFDKKFGDVVSDSEGNEKIVYDDEEISSEAARLRNEKLQPINAVKSKYQTAVKQDQFNKQIQTEFSHISKSIPDKFDIKIDDKNTMPYEIAPEYKKELIAKLNQNYAHFRSLYPDQKLDETQFLDSVQGIVMQDNFGNIANIYRQKGVSEKELEYSKKLENPIVEPKNLTNGAKAVVDMQAEAKKMRANLPKP